MELKIVSARKKRYDGLAHVSGETKFVDDIVVPGTLSVKAFRSPVSKGKIRNIDLSAAQGLPGVVAIITAADVPQNAFGMIPDQPVLAGEDIRYKGEPIAAVAAMDKRTAQAAVDLIKADIEEHQPVFSPIEAMQEGAPKVRPEGNVFEYGPNPFHRVNLGDVDKGFEAADRIIESSFFHAYLGYFFREPIYFIAARSIKYD